ncbi:hypothetical protein Aple_102810 [Acrocarpospora pleiomorpha]|uniref:DUF6879 domain-containing protein n=1 Tax=Acrocarpospora pleiomorpha TaxID=90975 RepID=A0A5M3Y5J7_9ACTN|nr:DUF6879 family protein [Acrocarpospora pleiomorpha]GES27381.1 hypothetical protein Aple_102810 [Acrocarpospora pleiomorpha]
MPEDVPLDFVGADPDSDDEKCPAVFVDPNTGDFLFQGRVITDPAVLAMISQHGTIASDEAVVWLPARMRKIILFALTEYDEGKQGTGPLTIAQMLARATRSAVHLEMREEYGPSPGFQDWRAGGSGRTDRTRWQRIVQETVARGVKMRRARIVSEPVSEYTKWLHMVTDVNIEAGEDVRWLPRRQASGIMLPHSDLWMFDQRLVAFNFNAGDGTEIDELEYSSDPRIAAQIVAAFEMVWERAIPHLDYKV